MTPLDVLTRRLAELTEQVETWESIVQTAGTAKYRKQAAGKVRELTIAADEVRGLILTLTTPEV
jgi:hypothetical protein